MTCHWLQECAIDSLFECSTKLALASHYKDWREEFDLSSVLDAVKHGYLDLLLGRVRENSWREAKETVRLSTPVERVKFAKDVAQFANGDSGGIILVGVRTRKLEGGVEVLSAVAALGSNPANLTPIPKLTQKMVSATLAHIYPPIKGLVIEPISTGSGQVIHAYTPPQTKKPYIVIGEGISGKYFGNFFSIPVRHGDRNSPISPMEIRASTTNCRSRGAVTGSGRAIAWHHASAGSPCDPGAASFNCSGDPHHVRGT